MAKTPKIELLSPAGGWDSLVAAVQNGADAVYFGSGGFNARASAANFPGEEAQKAIDYCHMRGVRAYLTLNTLVLDKEIPAALDTAKRLYEYGADAFIVQDVGLISLLRRNFLDIELHGSTQMSLHNAQGVEAAKQLGLSRVVLARETSLQNIRHICESVSGIGIEAFAHGAMCVSVSGQCLLSSFIGERSGNRGACAQPCRLPYRMDGAQGYLLSMKDMCMLEHIGELAAAGVDSLKIEGRMKRPEYVAVVTRAYRKAIDGEITDLRTEIDALKRIFDRGPFSTGYYYTRDGLVEGAKSGNVAAETDPAQLRAAQESYRDENRKVSLSAVFRAQAGLPAELTLTDGVVSVTASGEVVQQASKAPLRDEQIQEALNKLGGTPYAMSQLTLEIEANAAGIFLPVRALNELRRTAIAKLSETVAGSKHRTLQTPIVNPTLPKREPEHVPLLSARVTTVAQAEAALLNGANEIQIGLRQWNETNVRDWSDWAEKTDKPVHIVLPPVLLDEEFARAFSMLHNTAFAGAVAGNLSQIAPLRQLFGSVLGDFTLNVSNAASAAAHRLLGLLCVTLSAELTAKQLCVIMNQAPCDAVLYGKLPMMHLLHCPIRREAGRCQPDCAHGRTIIDRKGIGFDLLPMSVGTNRCDVQLLNSLPLDGLRAFDELREAKARAFVLLFTDETPDFAAERVAAFRMAMDGGEAVPLADSTGGHLRRGV